MITIKLGGYPFKLPQSWDEVRPDQAKKLSTTKPEQIHERLSAVSLIPSPKHIKLDPSVLLAAYEIISFVEDLPEIVPETTGPIDLANDWSFVEFEAARKTILEHETELGQCLYPLAEIKGLESTYVESGAKILDAIHAFLDQWGMFKDEEEDDEPSALEEAAGIERLKVFGSYSILEEIAAKFGKYPDEIERKPVGWVYLQYHYSSEKEKFQENYRKLSGK